jgi:hypothetical protein
MTGTKAQRPELTEEQISQVLARIASGFRDQIRSPILSTPADQGLDYESVTFPSEDGVPLEGWFIPCPGSDRVVIANHPRWFNRSGLPSHLEPWRSIGAATGNDFEVNFNHDYRLLNQAGYNVLAYDLRNHGHSGSGNGGLLTSGRFESRDVVGSLAYIRSRGDLARPKIALFSRCLGCNSSFFAIARRPELFDDVRCMVGVQPLSVAAIMQRMIEIAGVPGERIAELGERIQLVTSFNLSQLSPLDAARSVKMPTLLYQVRDDLMTNPADVQSIFDNVAAKDKELFWIEGTTRRWDGYTYFSHSPQKILDWLGARVA